jgi:preprotein translocase subunit SecF
MSGSNKSGNSYKKTSRGVGQNGTSAIAITKDTKASPVNLKNAISKVFGDIKINQMDVVGPQVSGGLVRQGLLAVAFAMLSMILYLAMRFNMPFAISGVIVLLADIAMALGFVSVFVLEMNLTMIAAFLTIIGYCINDTVVLYDRIRGNLKMLVDLTVRDCILIAVSDVLRRSIITSLVTILSLIGIMFFADISIRNFAFVVTFGIVCGTFGSVLVASIMPMYFGLARQKKKSQKKIDYMFYAS